MGMHIWLAPMMCRWFIEGESKEFAAEVEASCKEPGTRLRAPTLNMGLAPLCTDSFFGNVTVRYWRKGPDGQRLPDSLVELKSTPGKPMAAMSCPSPACIRNTLTLRHMPCISGYVNSAFWLRLESLSIVCA